MIILKIIVILSVVVSLGFSATQCDPDQFIEFRCQEPNCRNTLSDKEAWLSSYIPTKPKVQIVGYNINKFFVKNGKGKLSIINKNEVKFQTNSSFKNWKYLVKIHKTNFQVCDSTNENFNDSNITQMSSSNVMRSDEIDTEGMEKDKNENDESNMDVNIDQVLVNKDINISENKSISTGDGHISNSISVNNEQNDFKENINQNNIKSISSKKLENDSSAECLLGSSEKETNVIKEEIEKNVSVNTNSSYQQTNDAAINKQFSNVKNIDNSIQKSTNSIEPHNVNTASSQVNNITEEINTTNSHTQKIDNVQQTIQKLSDLDEADGLMHNSINNLDPQHVNTASSEVNNITEEINTTNSHTQKIDNVQQTTQKLSDIDEADGLMHNSINNLDPQHVNTASSEVNNITEEINKTNSQTQKIDYNIPQDNQQVSNIDQSDSLKQNSINNMELQNVSTPNLIDNITEESSKTNSQTQKVDPNIPQANQQLSDIDQANSLIQNSTNNLDPQYVNTTSLHDNIDNNNNGMNDFSDRIQGNSNSGSIPLKNDIVITDVINPQGSPVDDKLHDPKDSESQNILEENLSNVESTISDNKLINGNITYLSQSNEIINDNVIVSSSDYQTAGKVDVMEVSNQKSNDQCTSEIDCLNPMDNTPKYGYDSIQYETDNEGFRNIHNKPLDNNEKPNKLEPTNFGTLFNHPDTCSGVQCLKFNKNIEKTIISSLEKDMNNVNEESSIELSFLDHFQNWITSPTLNSINFLLNIFNEYSSEYNHIHPDQHIENKKGTYEHHLLTLLSAKDQSLLIVEKELSLLKEHSSGNTISTIERNSEIETLNEHLTKSEDIIASQAILIETLEEEVKELTENGMEMHSLLSSALESSTKSTEKINNLKVKLADSDNLNTALTQLNFDKTTELEKKNDVIKTLKTTIDEITNKNINLEEDNSKITSQLEQIITKKKLKESKLLGEINSLQLELDKQATALITAENEAIQSKDALQEMVSHKFNQTDANKLLSSIKLSAELKSANQMCGRYKQKLDESLKLNKQYLDHIDDLKSDIVKLENNLIKLEEEKEEAVNKLIILTKFFKEQEQGYLKQLNEKTLLYDNKEGESSDLNERIKSLNQEIVNYKSEIQSLKKEIIDQEASFKIQVSAADKKASDYWISFRQAERKLKEMELETAQLRNKLTMVDKKHINGTKSIDSSKDYEDELLDIPLPIVSPDFTLLDFEPPPPIFSPSLLQHDNQIFPSSPLQHTSVDQRLPPLGALGHASSPPLPLSRRNNRSLSPSSPPPSQRSSVFRPLPQRYNYMNRQNSLGHSVESLDK